MSFGAIFRALNKVVVQVKVCPGLTPAQDDRDDDLKVSIGDSKEDLIEARAEVKAARKRRRILARADCPRTQTKRRVTHRTS